MRRLLGALVVAAASLALAPSGAQQISSLNPVTSDLGQDYTVSTLPPCDASMAKRTAWVTDLMGLPNGDRAICDGSDWKPIRPLAVQLMPAASTTINALRNAPTVVINGSITTGTSVAITLGVENAYRGANICIVRKATGLGSMLITGLGNTLPLNGWVCYQFNGSGWEQTQSGGLL